MCVIYTGESIKCSVCESTSDKGSCLLRPPEPKVCENGLNFCIIVVKYPELGEYAL